MRRRLLAVAVSLVGVLLVALTVPLITTYAEDRTQDQFVRRLAHLNRFAVLSQTMFEAGDAGSLATDLERYVEVYGGSVAVVNANREVVASSSADDLDQSLEPVVDDALSGRTSLPPPTAWPWSSGTMRLGTPVGRDAEVLGAVVMEAPTDPVQDAVAGWLAWLALGGAAVLGLTVFGVVVPFVGWVMRPVHDLDAAARRLATGDLDSRAHEFGPPELRELAHTFNSMADSVQTSQRQQRDLVADAAHQLGNPLTALRLRIENLGQGADPEPVGAALEEADRLDMLVDALLDLSQVGAVSVTPEPRDVAAEVRARCAMWAPVFADLEIDVPAGVSALSTPGLVDLVLDALLDNAAKFAAGAPVVVRLEEGGEEVVLSVRDHGGGLPDDDVAKVGDRFFRGREHQNVPGTGLGLAIVRARVADVGGRLVVDRPPDGGLRVAVALRPGSRGSSGAPPGGGPRAT